MRYRLQPAEKNDAGAFNAADFIVAARTANEATVRCVKVVNFGPARSENAAARRERDAFAKLFRLVFDRKPTDAEIDAMIP